MKRLQIVLAIAIILIVSIVLSALIFRKKIIGHPDKLLAYVTDGADLELKSVQFVENAPEGKLWELTANTAKYMKKNEYALLDKVHILFFDKERGVMTLTSQKGKLFVESKDIEVFGNVVLTSMDGYVLLTDSLYYNSKERKVFTEAPVAVEGPGIKLRGVGLKLDIEAERVRVLKDVSTMMESSGTSTRKNSLMTIEY
jgi:LPS export ABC transporter protein LptC